MKAVLCSVVLAFAVAASAQTSRGTLTGTVLDSSGATVGGAHITLTGVATGVRRATVSNDAGLYRRIVREPRRRALDRRKRVSECFDGGAQHTADGRNEQLRPEPHK